MIARHSSGLGLMGLNGSCGTMQTFGVGDTMGYPRLDTMSVDVSTVSYRVRIFLGLIRESLILWRATLAAERY